jgi:hypothetical protein
MCYSCCCLSSFLFLLNVDMLLATIPINWEVLLASPTQPNGCHSSLHPYHLLQTQNTLQNLHSHTHLTLNSTSVNIHLCIFPMSPKEPKHLHHNLPISFAVQSSALTASSSEPTAPAPPPVPKLVSVDSPAQGSLCELSCPLPVSLGSARSFRSHLGGLRPFP